MAAAFDEEDLSLTISTSNTRRGSNNARVPEVSEPQPSATHPQANPTQIAKRLGQYEIIKTLGEGSFGKVKLAIHR
ncbi:Protein kinase, partial [Cryomyces antarcticus]